MRIAQLDDAGIKRIAEEVKFRMGRRLGHQQVKVFFSVNPDYISALVHLTWVVIREEIMKGEKK